MTVTVMTTAAAFTALFTVVAITCAMALARRA